MGSQDNEKVKNTIDGISNAISGDGRKFVAELKNFLRKFSGHIEDVVKDTVTDVGEGTAEQLTDLSLLEVNVTGSNGSPQNNIQVDFSNVNVTNYRQAQIWMKTGSDDFAQVGVTSGLRYIVENVKADTTYTIKVIAVNKNGGTSTFDEAPQKSITIKGSVLIPDAPRQFYLTWDVDGALWEWLYEDNGYVDFFELRLDANAGSYDENLLDRTRNTYSRVAPPVRSGTGYLFVRNVFGTYSQPAIHIFNKQLPLKPKPPTVVATLDGMVITMDVLPSNYQGWLLDIDGEEFKVYNRQFTYYQFSGEITVKYAFFDVIGRSEWSDSVTAKAKVTIDKEQLPEISYDDFDQAIKDAIDSANEQLGINETLQNSIGSVNKELEDIASELNQSITNINQTVDNVNADIGSIRTDIQGISQSIEGIEEGVHQNANGITSLYNSTQELDNKIASNTSLIQQTANSIESTVIEKVTVIKGELKGEIIDEIDDDLIAEVQKEVGSQVKQEADKITVTVYELVKDEVASEAAAQVKIEADKIKTTVYEKSEVDALLVDKADKDNVYTKTETSSQITQSANEITALVNNKTEELNGKIASNTSLITQTASEITSLVRGEISDAEERVSAEATSKISQSATEIKALINKEVASLDGKIASNTSAITQSADQIRSLVNSEVKTLDGKIASNTSAITQNANNITSVISGVNAIDNKVNDNASIIKQTKDSITSVITELNKDADKCSYSAITQLKGGIDLCVKDEDLNGNEIVSRINLTDGTVTIDGKHVHITGDTVFDNNVIVGGYIASDTINTDHLKTNSVTTAKIATNAITADKIQAGAITVDKITDKSITSTKIEDGAITTTKIVDGAVSTTKIEGGAITTDKIQAGSIIGEHISAGAVSADKLYAGDISMEGALALVGGAVRLDENGLTCAMADGASTVFDELGITYLNKAGLSFAQIRQMCIGTAEHGSRVMFSAPWDSAPSVVCVPTSIQVETQEYSQSDIFLNCKAVNVTSEGFDVQCYTSLGAGAMNSIPIDVTYYPPTAYAPKGEGTKETEYVLSGYQSSATKFILRLTATTYRAYESVNIGDNDTWVEAYATCKVAVYNDGFLIGESDVLPLPSKIYSPDNNISIPLENPLTFEGEVESIGEIAIKITTYYKGDYEWVTIDGERVRVPTTIKNTKLVVDSLTYNTETELVISTGTALFIATTGANNGYSVMNSSGYRMRRMR